MLEVSELGPKLQSRHSLNKRVGGKLSLPPPPVGREASGSWRGLSREHPGLRDSQSGRMGVALLGGS